MVCSRGHTHQSDVRVADVASGLELSVSGGKHTAQRAVAIELDLKRLVVLQPLRHQKRAREGAAERGGGDLRRARGVPI